MRSDLIASIEFASRRLKTIAIAILLATFLEIFFWHFLSSFIDVIFIFASSNHDCSFIKERS